MLTFPVQTTGTFSEPKDFADIIVRAAADGSVVRVRDVARVELGAEDYQVSMRLNGQPATGIGVYLRPGGNARTTADQVRAKMTELARSFPRDVEWRVPYDTTVFVNASIELVEHTFIEAFVLVLIVVYVFLGSIRATIIPMLAIPVSLVGTMAGLLLMGFSINMLTLFGLVLAIGIVVDDAIVVVEAVEKIMHDKGVERPGGGARGDEGHRRRHRRRDRRHLRGVRADRVPGRGHRDAVQAVRHHDHHLDAALGDHRAHAHAGAVRAHPQARRAQAPADPGLRPLLREADRRLRRRVGFAIRHWVLFLLVYGALIAAVLFLFKTIPGGFVPEEDKGTMFVAIDLPSGASQERVAEVLNRVETMVKDEPAVADVIGILGFSVFYRYANQGFVYVTLKDWKERDRPLPARAGADPAHEREVRAINDARVFAMNEPPISGMGNIAGFDYRLLALDGDRGKLDETATALVQAARGDERLAGVRNVAAPDVQTLFIDVDRNKAKSLGLPLDRRLPDHRHDAGLVLRQPVHRLRHQPQGQAPVGAAVPLRPRLPRRASTSATPRATWCRCRSWRRPTSAPRRSRSAATTAIRRCRSTGRPRRDVARARH